MDLKTVARLALALPLIGGTLGLPVTSALAQDQAEQRFVAQFQGGVGQGQQDAAVGKEGGRTVRRIDPSWTAFEISPAAAARLARNPKIRKVEADQRMTADFTPDDPCFSECATGNQWGIRRVNVPAAWDTVAGDNVDLPVAVLDTGVDVLHPELAGRVTLAANLSDSTTAADVNGHGTTVAGVIAAKGNNGNGLAGIGWSTQILSYKVLDDSGNGWTSDIAAGIRAAAEAGAKVINLSLSGTSTNSALESAVQYASGLAVIVSASGNQGSTTPTYPAAYPEVIGVAATKSDDSRASFSNYGSWVDLSAPGVGIASTLLGGGYGSANGTSFSSPIVAGIAALIWKSPHGTDPTSVKTRLLGTALPLSTVGMGAGLADASAAVGTGPAVAPEPEQTVAGPATTSSWTPWSSLGGIVSSAPDAVSDSAGNLTVLARGSDNALWVRELKGTNWTAWTSLGGILSSDPAAVSSGTGTIEVFVRGADGALWQKRRSGDAWSGWSSLGGNLSSDPSAASPKTDNVAVFARGGDGALWQRTRANGAWSGWQSLGGILSSSPDASSRGGGSIDVFAAGGDKSLWMRSFDGTSWSVWGSLGGTLSSDPAGVSWGSDRIDVFVRGADGGLWQKSWTGAWSPWSSLGGTLNSNPAAASRGAGTLDVLVAGADNALWLRSLVTV